MNQIKKVSMLLLVVFFTMDAFGQAVPPPIPPPPPPGLTLGIGEYFFLIAGLAFGVKHIKKGEDDSSFSK